MAASRAYGKNVLTLSVPGLCERSAVLQAHDAPPRLHRGHRVVLLPHPRLLLGYDFQGNYWKCRRCIMAFQSGSQSVRLVNKSFVVEGLTKGNVIWRQPEFNRDFSFCTLQCTVDWTADQSVRVWRREAQNFTYLKGLIKITLIDKAVLLVDRSQTEVKLKIWFSSKKLPNKFLENQLRVFLVRNERRYWSDY